LDHQIPTEGPAPRHAIHAYSIERDHGHDQPAHVCERRGGEKAPRDDDVKDPDEQARYRPDRGEPDYERSFKKQSHRQQQVADVAHPEQVAELVAFPVVNTLREEEDERQYAEETKFCAGRKVH